jgi:hypothetical protein
MVSKELKYKLTYVKLLTAKGLYRVVYFGTWQHWLAGGGVDILEKFASKIQG